MKNGALIQMPNQLFKIYEIRHDSLEYLRIEVEATRDGNSYNPTSDSVQVALPVVDVPPILTDWADAGWQTIDDDYFARVLVGPDGDINPGVGDFDILVKITDSPEVPVLRAGLLRVV
jgi:hypothetical protein